MRIILKCQSFICYYFFYLILLSCSASQVETREENLSPNQQDKHLECLDSIADRVDLRYVAIGFDDFRESDFSFVIPLFNKYGAKATFNRIHRTIELSENDMEEVAAVLSGGHELGDHTWNHYKFPFDEPLFNGQNPEHPEGGQIPFPSNSQLREDVGGGRNVFGILLSEPVNETCGYQAPNITTCWGNLSDDECQIFREYFSVMKDSNSGVIKLLDELSNIYLGTTGSSNGSWNDDRKCYTGGIFTGCKTSENHEIWERVLEVTNKYMIEHLGFRLYTWSWPGSKSSQCYFYKNGKYYYDSEYTLLANALAKFPSSANVDENGQPKVRSWTDVLCEYGYNVVHDSSFPGRIDGQKKPCMSIQYIQNARQSRPNSLIFRTNNSFHYDSIATEYNHFDDTDSVEVKMYDDGGSFKNAIETWRKMTANGVVWGEIIDSQNTSSESFFLEGLLKYGKAVGIEFITKSGAYNICFNRTQSDGNLIYNPKFRNTAKEFLPKAKTLPSNPDGYVGDCYVEVINDTSVLITRGHTIYDHYGIPYGHIIYAAQFKGEGSVVLKLIKNETNIDDIESGEIITSKIIHHPNAYDWEMMDLQIPDNGLEPYEQRCAGWGKKIIGIRIEYSGGLSIKNIKLFKKE